MRRFLAASAALWLISSLLLPSIAVARQYEPTAEPAVTTDAPNSNCESITFDNQWDGIDTNNTSWLETGAAADIYSSNLLYECIDTNGLDADNGVTYWVALEGNSFNEILQIGVIKCHESGPAYNEPCLGALAGQSRLFYAWGRDANCPGYSTSHFPYAKDLGTTVPAGTHNFKVWWDRDNGRIKFYYDGVKKADISDISLCWLEDNSTSSGSWYVERWDDGDGFSILFDNAVKGYYGHGWNNPGFQQSYCFTDNEPDFHCDVIASDRFQVWSEPT